MNAFQQPGYHQTIRETFLSKLEDKVPSEVFALIEVNSVRRWRKSNTGGDIKQALIDADLYQPDIVNTLTNALQESRKEHASRWWRFVSTRLNELHESDVKTRLAGAKSMFLKKACSAQLRKHKELREHPYLLERLHRAEQLSTPFELNAKYVNQIELRDAGWTDELIELLGAVDENPFDGPRRANSVGEEEAANLFGIRRVAELVASPDFPCLDVIEKTRTRALPRRSSGKSEYAFQLFDFFAEKFPELSRPRIVSLTSTGLSLFRPEQLDYRRKLGTENYWKSLGYQVPGTPCGFVLDGNTFELVFHADQIGQSALDDEPDDVWQWWSQKYESEKLALAEALRFANRLQKVKRISGFYEMKDNWIECNQANLVEGYRVREEERECRNCCFDFEIYLNPNCDRCGGTGIEMSGTLYLHKFCIEERFYSFHSYKEPIKISDEPGADEEMYGSIFTEKELPLPPQHVLVEVVRLGLEKVGHSPSASQESM